MRTLTCATHPPERTDDPQVAGLAAPARGAGVVARAADGKLAKGAVGSEPVNSVIKPINGDPYIAMLETPVTSAPIVASFLSNLPAYKTAISPLLRGVEIGLVHGFLVVGPFIKLGPLRASAEADLAGSLAGAGLVVILTVCLTIYGAATFQTDGMEVGVKTLSGRSIEKDPLQSKDGWTDFTSGFLIGGLSGAGWAYVCTQILPFYASLSDQNLLG